MFQAASAFHLNTLFILGLALFGGTVGGRFFQKIRIPQVVGYIVIGFAIGQSGLGIISPRMLQTLQPFSYFALGLIGFMIGGELNAEVLKKHGRQFMTILLAEGLFSFILVTLVIGLVGSRLIADQSLAWALAILLGAISSATAPAATTDVLWEYKAKGPLTTMVFGIVALDDVLAIALFAVASSIATRLQGINDAGLLSAFIHPLYEIGGAVVVGVLSGLVLTWIIGHYREKERMFVFLVGTVLLVLGLSVALNVSMLLAAMVLGAVVTNRTPTMSKQVFSLVKDFTPPIFVLFFVFVGAKLNIGSVNPLILTLVLLYLMARTAGKMLGAYSGAQWSGAGERVKKYLPFCLFSQAGVAIGLSLVATHFLDATLGNAIIVIITVSTFFVQMIGPPCVKYAITKAREAGKNITEDDIIRAATVKELMDPKYPLVREDAPAAYVVDIFSNSPYTQYPVINKEGHLSGVINIDGVKNSLMFERSGKSLSGADLKEDFRHTINPQASLFEAKAYMDNYRLGFLPVSDKRGVVLGGFDRRMYKKFVSTKLLELQ